jgi:hypothetical protein
MQRTASQTIHRLKIYSPDCNRLIGLVGSGCNRVLEAAQLYRGSFGRADGFAVTIFPPDGDRLPPARMLK